MEVLGGMSIYKLCRQYYNQGRISGLGGDWMEIRTARALQEQLVCGPLKFFHRDTPVLKRYSSLTPVEEQARFEQARRKAVLQLASYYDRTVEEVGEEFASIFAIHAMLLEEEDLEEHAYQMIWEEKATAEYAVFATGKLFANIFSAMDDPYMKARAADIRDLTRRVIQMLGELKWDIPELSQASILVTDEFLPSEVLEIDRSRLLGVVSCKGSLNSHAALLLKAYHIPCMVGAELEENWDGHMAMLDGAENRIYLDPEPVQKSRLCRQYEMKGMPVLC